MEIVLEILKFIVPAILVLIVTYFMLNSFMDNEEKRRVYHLRRETRKNALPVRLQAYERLTLLLERISPNSLLLRVPGTQLTAGIYHSMLLQTIRAEYEHNLAQQVYITPESWQLVKSAKDSVIGLINRCAKKVDPEAPATELTNLILNTYMKYEVPPTERAIEYLKHELKTDF